MEFIKIKNREIGKDYKPFVIAEIGINHEGSFGKAKKMVEDAFSAGAECVKFQHHVIKDEMAPAAKKVIPGNAKESIWKIMERCVLSIEEHRKLKEYAEDLGMIYLCTPFSRKAAVELESIGVDAYKIGSGECNNYPLLKHIAGYKKPIIISTGMNNLKSVRKAVEILQFHNVPYAILHCTSMYPTPYKKVRLGALHELKENFDAPIGLSDHSIGNYTCFAAVALGASILEKHFTSDKTWPGPDISISIDPAELKDLIIGSEAIHNALGGKKNILPDEQVTIDFAYSSVVSIKDIKRGEVFTKSNLWVKRPGTGIPAEEYDNILGKKASRDIPEDTMISREDFKR